MTMNCLKGVMIRSALANSIALCEHLHSQDLDTLAGDFIRELIKFSVETILDPDAFYHEPDKAAVIVNLIYEDSCSHELQKLWDELEDRLHPIQLRDELDDLLNNVVDSVVFTTENVNFYHIHSANSPFYQFAITRHDEASAKCRNTPRQKFRQAVLALNYALPGHKLDLVWWNRKNIYKTLNQDGWFWSSNRLTGSWHSVPF